MRQCADIVIVAFLMIVPVCSEIPVPVFCRRQPLVILEKFNEGVFVFKSALCGLPTLSLPAYRDEETKPLYFPIEEAKVHPITARFIPYFAFANRGKSDMRVFVRRFSK